MREEQGLRFAELLRQRPCSAERKSARRND
jgi:hypothetical protein